MPDGSSEIESEMVIFSDVTKKHAGIYKCSATNGFGKQASKKVEVVVEYSPEVEVSEVFVQTKSGEKAEIVCQVHAVPKPTIMWTKDGQTVRESSRVKTNHFGGGRHLLTIMGVQPADFGKYSCKAANKLGSQQKDAVLTGENIILFIKEASLSVPCCRSCLSCTL